MERLIEIIGLAPSELSLSEVMNRVQQEHNRVLSIFANWKVPEKVKKSRDKKKDAGTKKEVNALCMASGITPEQLIAILQANKEGKI